MILLKIAIIFAVVLLALAFIFLVFCIFKIGGDYEEEMSEYIAHKTIKEFEEGKEESSSDRCNNR